MQTKGDGPLDLLVADYFASAAPAAACAVMRGSTRRGSPRADNRLNSPSSPGSGALAITIEPKKGAQTLSGHRAAVDADGLVRIGRDLFLPAVRTVADARSRLVGAVRPIAPARAAAGAPARIMVQAVAWPRSRRADETNDDWQRIALFLKTLQRLRAAGHGDLGRIGRSGACSTRTRCACIRRQRAAVPAAAAGAETGADRADRALSGRRKLQRAARSRRHASATRCEFCATATNFRDADLATLRVRIAYRPRAASTQAAQEASQASS